MVRQEQRRWGQAKLLRSGQMIRELREAANVTTTRMCSEIGMTKGQLSEIERGILAVSLRRAHQIQQVLGVSFDDIIAQLLLEKLHEAGFREVELKVVLASHASESQTIPTSQCNLEITSEGSES